MKLLRILVLSCKRATFLIEKSHTKPLDIIDNFQLKMHLKLCDACGGYQKQSFLIENLLTRGQKDLSNISNLKLSDKSKDLIHKVIQENLKNK